MRDYRTGDVTAGSRHSLGCEWDEEWESGRGKSWGEPQQSESRRSPAGQGMRVGNGGVGELAGCCGLKSALRGAPSGECAYGGINVER
jgi:hypothetical protein